VSRKPSRVMSPAARARSRRRALRAEMARVAELVEREVRAGLAVLDEPTMGTERDDVVLDGRIIGDEIITD
jgi:hypothetical protein